MNTECVTQVFGTYCRRALLLYIVAICTVIVFYFYLFISSHAIDRLFLLIVKVPKAFCLFHTGNKR